MRQLNKQEKSQFEERQIVDLLGPDIIILDFVHI